MKKNTMGMTLVLDSSVIGKIYVEEEGSQEAADLLILGREADVVFKISELLHYEVGNVIWKYFRKKKGYGGENLFQLFLLDVERVPLDAESAQDALKLAHHNDISYYDAVHVSLALSSDAPLVTEDKELLERFDFAIGIKDALKKLE